VVTTTADEAEHDAFDRVMSFTGCRRILQDVKEAKEKGLPIPARPRPPAAPRPAMPAAPAPAQPGAAAQQPPVTNHSRPVGSAPGGAARSLTHSVGGSAGQPLQPGARPIGTPGLAARPGAPAQAMRPAARPTTAHLGPGRPPLARPGAPASSSAARPHAGAQVATGVQAPLQVAQVEGGAARFERSATNVPREEADRRAREMLQKMNAQKHPQR
jgi:hypothetical protein